MYSNKWGKVGKFYGCDKGRQHVKLPLPLHMHVLLRQRNKGNTHDSTLLRIHYIPIRTPFCESSVCDHIMHACELLAS